jgi:hypothetical protein
MLATGFNREHKTGDKSAHLLSKDASEHDAQLTYFRGVLEKELDPDFYNKCYTC